MCTKNQNKYEKLFDEYLDLIEFSLVKHNNGWGLKDHQGANIGGVESDRFNNAAEIIDRLDTYSYDYIVKSLEDQLGIAPQSKTWNEIYEASKNSDEWSWDTGVLYMIINAPDLNINLENCTYTIEEEYIPTVEDNDRIIEAIWKEFEDVPMNPDDETIEKDFRHFGAGTDRSDIWAWFDKRHSKGIRYLLYNEQEGHLLKFIQDEVPFRLKEILKVPEESITEKLIADCVDRLYNNDVMFDYDSIDRELEEQCQESGIFI